MQNCVNIEMFWVTSAIFVLIEVVVHMPVRTFDLGFLFSFLCSFLLCINMLGGDVELYGAIDTKLCSFLVSDVDCFKCH